MYPETVKLVQLADCAIKIWHKHAFRLSMCALLNLGVAVVNCLNCYKLWDQQGFLGMQWFLLFLVLVSLFMGIISTKDARVYRRRERLWRNIRHNIMQFDACDNVSRATLYMDQVEASLRDL